MEVGDFGKCIGSNPCVVDMFGFFDCFSRDEVVNGECGELLIHECEFITEDNTLACTT